MRFKNIIIFGIVVLAISASVGSCATPPVKRFYTIINEQTKHPANMGPKICARSLVIAQAESISPYKDEKIIFRTDSYEVKHFNYRLWVSSPEEMMHSLLMRKLEQAKIFTAIETFVNSSSEHLTLYPKLNAIEELDIDGQWHARLGMQFVMKDDRDENIIWEHEFDKTQKVDDEEVPELIHTMSLIYNAEANKMIARMRKFLVNYAPCKKTEEYAPPQREDIEDEEFLEDTDDAPKKQKNKKK